MRALAQVNRMRALVRINDTRAAPQASDMRALLGGLTLASISPMTASIRIVTL